MSERSGNVIKVKKKWGKVYEKTIVIRDIVLDETKAAEIEKDIKNSKVVTPQSLAQKHGIRVSLARRILKKLAESGDIRLKHKVGINEIYTK